MSFNVVINTCAMQPGAASNAGPSGVPYSQRVDFIKSVILPRVIGDPFVEQVCIAGEFEPPTDEGLDYAYVPVSSAYHNCRDVLAQRQAGWDKVRNSGADATLFLMDDHVPDDSFFWRAHEALMGDRYDVLSPNRRSRRTGFTLNSGWNGIGAMDPQGPYAHTHGIILTPKAMAVCPWAGLTPIYRFDVLHSQWFADRGLFVRVSPEIFLEDLEE